ncbi:hypothetical protein LXL04_024177 [Taraxacum kok-saghyz]
MVNPNVQGGGNEDQNVQSTEWGPKAVQYMTNLLDQIANQLLSPAEQTPSLIHSAGGVCTHFFSNYSPQPLHFHRDHITTSLIVILIFIRKFLITSRMSTQSEAPSTTPSVQVVGNAFVEQYYHILHHSPDMVHKFYQESSFISRPDEDGAMTTVTTMKGINDKICSLDYTAYKAEIKTADAQESYKDGVMVLVTGCLTKKDDNQRKKFIQSFFLAPQDKGFFVLNDVFRYVDEGKLLEDNHVVVEGTNDDQTTPLILDPPSQDVDSVDPPSLDVDSVDKEEVEHILENENKETHPNIEESISSTAEELEVENAPKMSYASILSSQKKGNINKVYVLANTSRSTSIKTQHKIVADVAQGQPPEVSAVPSSSISSPDTTTNVHDEGDGHSIYIRNLPPNATVAQLETEFNKFGPIKPGGIQVRSNKQLGFCFGFVEYQDVNSMQNAIKNSPVVIGGREAVVEIKKTTTRVGAGRGRFPAGRGGFRSDSFRGRGGGSFNGGGRGYGGGYQQGRGRGGGGRRGGSAQYVSTT